MMWLIYNLGIYLFFIILAPYYLLNLATQEKYRAGLSSRLGLNAGRLKEKCAGKKIIWFHAVSVGEVLAVLPLIEAVKKRFTGYNIVLSTTTMTSNRLAQKNADAGGIDVIYFPLDFPWAVRKIFDAVSPRLVVLTETELWPNFLRYASLKLVPVVLVNGRISDSSFKSYKLVKSFFKEFTAGVKIFGMQSDAYRENIIKLGADGSRTVVTGNLKYDTMGNNTIGDREIAGLRTGLGIPAGDVVIFGGSTHPGEEEILINIFAGLKKGFAGITLFLAPRHIDRAAAIEKLAREKGLRAGLKTKVFGNPDGKYDAIVLDTIGELSVLYAVGDIVFMGKSLTAAGGQNILEPARMGKAVVFGPRMNNFRDEASALIKGGGAFCVNNAAELEAILKGLLNDPEKRRGTGGNAAKVVEKYRAGIMENSLAIVTEALRWN